MKKTLLTAAVVALLGGSAFAQEDGGGMKFADGDKNLELMANPLGGSFSMNGIKLRMFSADAAIRLGINIGGSSSKDVNAQAVEDANPVMYDKTSEMTISIRPGYEMHMPGTDRLSPYMGAELDFTIMRETTTNEYWDATDEAVENTKTKDGSTTFGLNLLAGADWYFTKKAYLGCELGFGFAMTSMSDTKTEYSDSDAEPDPNDPTVNGSSMNWGPNVNSSLRLGFLF